MGLFILIPGIVLVAIPHYFQGQNDLGVALIVIGAVLLVIQVLWFAFVASRVSRATRDFDSFSRRSTRRRRGF